MHDFNPLSINFSKLLRFILFTSWLHRKIEYFDFIPAIFNDIYRIYVFSISNKVSSKISNNIEMPHPLPNKHQL